jgi:hypothetical protein
MNPAKLSSLNVSRLFFLPLRCGGDKNGGSGCGGYTVVVGQNWTGGNLLGLDESFIVDVLSFSRPPSLSARPPWLFSSAETKMRKRPDSILPEAVGGFLLLKPRQTGGKCKWLSSKGFGTEL